MASPSQQLEAFGAGLGESFIKGMEQAARRREELGIPDGAGIEDPRVRALALEAITPETAAWLERTVKRSWWALYDDEGDEGSEASS